MTDLPKPPQRGDATFAQQADSFAPKRRVDTEVFVGGPADGRRMKILHGNRVLMPSSTLGHPAPEYRRETFAGETVDFDVWVSGDLTTDDALAMLMRGYRR